jgi:hypothetical protein
MSKPQKPRTCVQIEPDLIAAATGEATGEAEARVQTHVATCVPCRDDFTRYRAVDAVVGTLRGETTGGRRCRGRPRTASSHGWPT